MVICLVAACTTTPGATGQGATFTEPGAAGATTEPAATSGPAATGEALPTAAGAASDFVLPETDIGDGRPSTVTVTVAGNTSGADGSYTATGTTRACGNLFIDPDAFVYEFPFEGEHNPRDVSFAASPLRPGESTTTFNIDIGIETNQITPSIIADPGGTPGDAGTASRTHEGGTTTLVLHATNNRSETIDLTATCGPRP